VDEMDKLLDENYQNSSKRKEHNRGYIFFIITNGSLTDKRKKQMNIY
jgi:hypothetical protein